MAGVKLQGEKCCITSCSTFVDCKEQWAIPHLQHLPAPVNYPALPAMPISASSPPPSPPYSMSSALPHCQDVDSLGCESNEREVRSQYWRNDRVLGSWFGVTSGRCMLT
ncbi:hypothetical protein OUZ56_017579 [Daphnia magna]|uniref:Uncharacterized protein n=1 Tax=Daphnia magna TaxID=35525 RepID=A0ABR0AT53_9CRUS|nr:hypothetical protein OUZ56_017579 [Daphnia magna]